MIELTRFSGRKFILNVNLIQYVEETPDTVITLTTNEKLMVREAAQDVVQKATDYWKRLHQEPPGLAVSSSNQK